MLMMNRTRTAGLVLLGAALMAGCATSKAATNSSPHRPVPAGTSMSPGMRRPDGSIMGAGTTAAPSAAAHTDRPSASAAMICNSEVRNDIIQVLALKTAPHSTARFVDHLYTCTYRLPAGPLVISVKDLADAPATSRYYITLRHMLGNPAAVAGLGQGAFGTSDGKIVLRKDSHVLQVDASGLPAVFGAQSEKRSDFAYEIASDILGCWTNG
jgi:hypothetical protein